MKIMFLGVNTAFANAMQGQFNSNMLISKDVEVDMDVNPSSQMGGPLVKSAVVEQKHLLFDAGRTITEALTRAKFIPEEIDSIYISHNHADHSGGMEYLGFKTYFGTYPFGQNRPRLFGHTSVLDELWDANLKAGMRSIQGQTNDLSTYWRPEYIQDNGSFDFYGTKMELVQVIHVVDDRRVVPSYGLMIHENGKKIFITSDAQYAPKQMMTFYEQADVIYHDCEVADYDKSVHAQYRELVNLPKEIKNKMYLYHYSVLPEEIDPEFKGFVTTGETHEY